MNSTYVNVSYRWDDSWSVPDEYDFATLNRFLYINYISAGTYDGMLENGFPGIALSKPQIADPFSNVRKTGIINLHSSKVRICPECFGYGYITPHHQIRLTNKCFACGHDLVETKHSLKEFSSLLTLPFVFSKVDYSELFDILSTDRMIKLMPVFKQMVSDSLPVYPAGFFEFYSHGLISESDEVEAAKRLISEKPFKILQLNEAMEQEYQRMRSDIADSYIIYRNAEEELGIRIRLSGDEYTAELSRRIETYPDGFIEAVRSYLCRSLFAEYDPHTVIEAFENGTDPDSDLGMRVSFAMLFITKSCRHARFAVTDENMMYAIKKPSLYGENVLTSIGANHIFNLTGSETEDEYQQKVHISRLAHYLFSKKTFADNFRKYASLNQENRSQFKFIPAAYCIALTEEGSYHLKQTLIR